MMITVLKQNFKTKMIQNKNYPHTQVYIGSELVSVDVLRRQPSCKAK